MAFDIFLGQIIFVLIAGILVARIAKFFNWPEFVALLLTGFIFGNEVLKIFKPLEIGISLGFLAVISVPIILFNDGARADSKQLLKKLSTVLSINTVAVVFTISGVALAAYFFLGFSWLAALLLGAILASTDPASILPLLRKLRIEKKISSIIESETAFNDASSLTIFLVLTTLLAGGVISFSSVSTQFVSIIFF
ncbi:Na(+)/H(+) antiporter 1 [uncultured archaeon]|nr:Na(+)/H(+) antiporter 1 [uncultured archaeon]